MRTIVKSRTTATAERLGGCGFPGCHATAVCSNCIQCAEHHGMQQLLGTCGFDEPLPVSFAGPDELAAKRSGVLMLVVDDNNPTLEGKPETTLDVATMADAEEILNA